MNSVKSIMAAAVFALGLGAITTSVVSCGPSKQEQQAIGGISDLVSRVEKEAANYTAEDWEKVYKEYEALTQNGNSDWNSPELLEATTKLLELASKYVANGADPSRFSVQTAPAGTEEPSIDGAEPSIDGEVSIDAEPSADDAEPSAE